ncbi:MAG: helix-turn-helix domain-containing protein [Planctomycetota bacterium]
MAKRSSRQTHIVRSDEPVRVTVEPVAAQSATWFRMFRSLIHGGTWAELTPAAAKVLIVLAECVNDSRRRESGRWVAWPSVATIAQRSGCQRRAVQKALANLEERGLIARCRRRNAKRGDYSNEYELQPPANPPAHDETHGGMSDDAPPPVYRQTPVRRTTDRPASAPNSAQQRRTRPKKDQTTVALADAGVGEPTLSRLLDEHERAELLLRVEDWKRRKKLGQRLGPAWLIASIRDGYDLHPDTQADLDKQARAAKAKQRRQAKAAEQAEADTETQRIETEAAELFDTMSDDELDHWKQTVLESFPIVARGLHRADPRTNEKLRHLILGKLAHLVA